MKVLLIYAHPEPRSLNGALKNLPSAICSRPGMKCRFPISTLCAGRPGMTPTIAAPRRSASSGGRPSIPNRPCPGTQSADIAAEQEKLLWADTVIFQFPLWWFSMPAIMKGWIDRVYAWALPMASASTATATGGSLREGTFVGKRAMLIVTAGGWAEHYSPRGINGPIDDILFPIQHGMLFYPGFEVLPPLVFYRTDKTDAGQFADQCAAWPSGWTRCGKPSPFHSAARIMAII
nr:NAD(P)H-dependent oxidoreductase [Klebsiella pneumoniae subsp. pneumoniae]